ncbi:MAG TPA: type II toxin-antitoxin system RelE/ParE family toxin [Vicinamibacterales bacterium]|nr:type II toxin-antitoxin system RelE/ParE family toxin [Vicinamibacterales bacterium]
MESADADLWDEMEIRLFALMEQGNTLGWPASEPVGDGTGLFVLRAKSSKGQGRLFYFFHSLRRIVFVHSVPMKKTRVFQRHDIDMALERKRIVEKTDLLASVATAFKVDPHDDQVH